MESILYEEQVSSIVLDKIKKIQKLLFEKLSKEICFLLLFILLQLLWKLFIIIICSIPPFSYFILLFTYYCVYRYHHQLCFLLSISVPISSFIYAYYSIRKAKMFLQHSLQGCIFFDEQKLKYLIYYIKFLLSSKPYSAFLNLRDGFLLINICIQTVSLKHN